MNRPEELIKKIYEEQGQIKDVFLQHVEVLQWIFIRDSILSMQNQKLCILIGLQQRVACIPIQISEKGALVILCSHGGNTNETVNAAKLAKERGAAVITMTHNPNSICAQEDMNPVVYSWEDDTNEKKDRREL